MLPAVGQGALGIETREDDQKTRAMLAVVHHKESAIAVAAERGVMFALDEPTSCFAITISRSSTG